ncbi:MAG: hypothetical protein ACYDCC_08400 [Actinomycetota bacterium]
MKTKVARVTVMLLSTVFLLAPVAGARAAISFDGSLSATNPAAVAVDGVHHRLYVGEQNGDFIIASTDTLKETARLHLGCCIASIAVDSANDRVIVAGNGLFVIDAAQTTVVATIGLNGDALSSVALDSPVTHAYVVLPAKGQVSVVDLTAMAETTRFNVSSGLLGQIAWYNGGRLFVTEHDTNEVHALDARTGAEAGPITSYLPVSLAVDTANGVLYVASDAGSVDVIDAVTFNHLRSLASGTIPMDIALSNGRVWVSSKSDPHLRLLRSSDGAILDRYPLAGAQGSIAYDSTYGVAYVAVPTLNEVVVMHEAPGVVQIQTPFPNTYLGINSSIMTGAAPPGATVTLTENGVLVGSAVADDSSHWSTPVHLSEGTHTVIASAPEESPSPPKTFFVDLTPPSPSLIYRTPPNAAGWNDTTVSLRWSCADSFSGPVQSEIDTFLALDGANLSASVTCVDHAGNTATLVVGGFNVDRFMPYVFVNQSPYPNNAGWNRASKISVTLRCADPLSGLTNDYHPVSATVFGETPGTPVDITCTTIAGLTRKYEDIIRNDVTAPTASVDNGVVAAEPLPVIQTVLPITGTATDALSKPDLVQVLLTDSSGTSTPALATCSSNCGEDTMNWSFTPDNSFPAGVYTVTARAMDLAGNIGAWSAPQTVAILTIP